MCKLIMQVLVIILVIFVKIALFSTYDQKVDTPNIPIKSGEVNLFLLERKSHMNDVVINAKSLGIYPNRPISDIANIKFNQLNDYTTLIVPSGTYIFDKKVTINKRLKLVGNGVVFKFSNNYNMEGTNTFKMFQVMADEVQFEGITFGNGTFPGGSKDNVYIWNTRGKSMIEDCEFKDLPLSGRNFNGAIAFLSGGKGENIVSKCKFYNCPGGAFTQQSRDIFMNNVAINPKDVSFVINGPSAFGCSIKNNKIYNYRKVSAAGHIAVEQGSTEFEISENYIYGIKNGYGIGAVDVGGYTGVGVNGNIHNNIIDGANYVSSNAQVGIVVNAYYDEILVHNNVIKNIGIGHPSNACMQIGTGNVKVYNNTIDNKSDIALSISGVDRNKTIDINNNRINNNSNASCIKFLSSNLENTKVKVRKNYFLNSVEGINTTLLTSVYNLSIGDNRYSSIIVPLSVGKQ